MANPIYLPNLKSAGSRATVTGTVIGQKECLDVNIANSISTSAVSLSYIEHRFHDASATNINASGGAWIQLEAAADISTAIAEMRINWNGGSALLIGKGASAGAVTVIDAVGAGQTEGVGVALVAGDKVWVRALQNAAITAGELLVKFLG